MNNQSLYNVEINFSEDKTLKELAVELLMLNSQQHDENITKRIKYGDDNSMKQIL